MKVEESLNVTFNESPPPTKLSPLVDDDVVEEKAIEKKVKVNNNVENESIEVDEIRDDYIALEDRLFHERRYVEPSLIEANNMLPLFRDLGLESFLTLDEQICPRLHQRVMNPLDIPNKTIKNKGKRAAPPSPPSSPSSNGDEEPSFMDFYEELPNDANLTDKQKEKKGCSSA
ncbi:hypothetical protein Tco_0853457 [Tanacetum coccineum]